MVTSSTLTLLLTEYRRLAVKHYRAQTLVAELDRQLNEAEARIAECVPPPIPCTVILNETTPGVSLETDKG